MTLHGRWWVLLNEQVYRAPFIHGVRTARGKLPRPDVAQALKLYDWSSTRLSLAQQRAGSKPCCLSEYHLVLWCNMPPSYFLRGLIAVRVWVRNSFLGALPQRTGLSSVGKVLCGSFPANQYVPLFLPDQEFGKQCWSSVEVGSTKTQTGWVTGCDLRTDSNEMSSVKFFPLSGFSFSQNLKLGNDQVGAASGYVEWFWSNILELLSVSMPHL